MLVECTQLHSVWEYVKSILKDHKLEWNAANIMCDKVHSNSKHIANLVVLITKQYIYRCKCEGTIPKRNILQAEIIMYYKADLYRSRNNRQVDVHITKWLAINDFLLLSGCEMPEYIKSKMQMENINEIGCEEE